MKDKYVTDLVFILLGAHSKGTIQMKTQKFTNYAADKVQKSEIL
jgi:hypothetical protein